MAGKLSVLVALATGIPLVLLAATPIEDSGSTSLHVTVTKAPVAPDGTTVGAVTDFVLTVAIVTQRRALSLMPEDADPGVAARLAEYEATLESK